jgi:hypothetical protein
MKSRGLGLLDPDGHAAWTTRGASRESMGTALVEQLGVSWFWRPGLRAGRRLSQRSLLLLRAEFFFSTMHRDAGSLLGAFLAFYFWPGAVACPLAVSRPLGRELPPWRGPQASPGLRTAH